GLALFAGWTEPANQDTGGLHRFLASTTHEERREILTALGSLDDAADDHASDWPRTFERFAATIAQEFAGRVRGFRQADPATVAKSFFARPGLIQISERRILVALSPSPFHVALRISSMDEAVASVGWLGGRTVEF